MDTRVVVHPSEDYPEQAALAVAEALPGGGSLVLTGGTTVQPIYPRLAGKRAWADVAICFSDERCVPPDHAESNYAMAKRLFLEPASPPVVHRMRGELDPPLAAADYENAIRGIVTHGFDLMLLGMGADCHIAALYPGSPALDETRLAAAVDRPDGMKGITLTPPAILSARKILVLVTGDAKASAIERAVGWSESVSDCPARLLADHPDVTFVLDRPAAALL